MAGSKRRGTAVDDYKDVVLGRVTEASRRERGPPIGRKRKEKRKKYRSGCKTMMAVHQVQAYAKDKRAAVIYTPKPHVRGCHRHGQDLHKRQNAPTDPENRRPTHLYFGRSIGQCGLRRGLRV